MPRLVMTYEQVILATNCVITEARNNEVVHRDMSYSLAEPGHPLELPSPYWLVAGIPFMTRLDVSTESLASLYRHCVRTSRYGSCCIPP